MKWFDKWFINKARWAWEHRDDAEEVDVYSSPKVATRRNNLAGLMPVEDVESDTGLNITVRKAIGGKIITFRHYDHKTDRSSNKLYIVPDELDFERELGKMITLESMRS